MPLPQGGDFVYSYAMPPIFYWRFALTTTLAALSLSAATAQQGAVTFKQFKPYPKGQWQQTSQPYRNGAPVGSPITNTTCTSPLTPSAVAAIKNFGNSVAPQCTMRVLADTERTAEYEQVCETAAGTQVNHSTMHAIDDQTITSEVRMSIDGREFSEVRSTLHYQGVCTVPEKGPVMPAMPKPSAEDCAKVSEMRQQAEDGARSCTNMAAADRPPNCEATMQRLLKNVEVLATACR